MKDLIHGSFTIDLVCCFLLIVIRTRMFLCEIDTGHCIELIRSLDTECTIVINFRNDSILVLYATTNDLIRIEIMRFGLFVVNVELLLVCGEINCGLAVQIPVRFAEIGEAEVSAT